MRKSILAALMLATLGSTAAIAADEMYAGASLTRPDVRALSDQDYLGNGLKVYGGYRLHPNFAVEVAYGEGRNLHANGDSYVARDLSAAVVGSYVLGHNVSLLGKVGVAHTRLDGDNQNGVRNDVVYGVGAEYALTSKVALRAEVERFEDYARTDSAMNQFSLGARYKF